MTEDVVDVLEETDAVTVGLEQDQSGDLVVELRQLDEQGDQLHRAELPFHRTVDWTPDPDTFLRHDVLEDGADQP